MQKDKNNTEINLNWMNLFGFQDDLDRIMDLIKASKWPPVVLLEGREAIGKKLLAAAISAMHFCERGSFCGECPSCQLIRRGLHPEVLWVETPEKQIKLNDAAAIQEHLSFQPGFSGGARIAVIIDFDKLNTQSANRLLAVLEEPPPYAKIILTTSRLKNLLPTIRSRTVVWHLSPPKINDTLEFLRVNFAEGDPPISLKQTDQELEVIIKRMGYAPGKARAFLREHENGDNFIKILDNLAKEDKDVSKILKFTEGLKASSNFRLNEFIEEMEIYLNDSYRKMLGVSSNIQEADEKKDYVRFRNKRREILSQIKRLNRSNNLNVNSAMTAEVLTIPTCF